MKSIVIILCLISFNCVKCHINDETIKVVYEDTENNCDYKQYEETYSKSMFFKGLEETNETEIAQTRIMGLFNCFGLTGKFPKLLENFLENDANGTQALKVAFYSSSRKQPKRVPVPSGESFSLAGIDFDIRRRTIFIVHGFRSNIDKKWITDMEEAFLLWGDLNVFVVDWRTGSDTWNYLKAAVNTKAVGDQIANLINQIVNYVNENNHVDPHDYGRLHLIGHSLGAHICGHTSHQLKLRGIQWPVFRITGLDPAKLCFRHSDLSVRLDRSDAEFVDVIHSNMETGLNFGLGLPYPIGHVDIYPNGGRVQPGCLLTQSPIGEIFPLPSEKINRAICSHGRSHQYFLESLYTAVYKNCTFWAHEWDMSYDGLQKLSFSQCELPNKYSKCIEMGINAEKYSNRGTFFALTGSSSPYCKVNMESTNEVWKNIWKGGFLY